MARTFTITTTATDTLKADAKGHAEAVFTVTNATARPVRGMARAKGLADTKREWLSIGGDTERDFGGGGTEQFSVSFDAAGAPAGKYPLRLDVASAINPDEDFTEGPTVTVEVAAAAATPPVTQNKFPVWVIFVILGVVVIIGVVVLILVLSSRGKQEGNGEATPTPVEATPTPTPIPTATPTPSEVANRCETGYVWREANASDKVCVTPEIRAQTQEENRLAASRRSPNGGPYGPDTCLQGYVWREAFPGDVVCVPPSSRDQARRDNARNQQ
jgi:hypothetical protein